MLATNRSCQKCIHFEKQDIESILWDFEPPNEYECEIQDIEKTWSNKQMIIEASFKQPYPDFKLNVIASNCPSFQFSSKSKTSV